MHRCCRALHWLVSILHPASAQCEDPVAALQLQYDPKVQELLGDIADEVLKGAQWGVLQKLEEWAVRNLRRGVPCTAIHAVPLT
jgi:hypothetical protein